MRRRKLVARGVQLEAQIDSLLLQKGWAFREAERMASKGFDTAGIVKYFEVLDDTRYNLQQSLSRLVDRLYGTP